MNLIYIFVLLLLLLPVESPNILSELRFILRDHLEHSISSSLKFPVVLSEALLIFRQMLIFDIILTELIQWVRSQDSYYLISVMLLNWDNNTSFSFFKSIKFVFVFFLYLELGLDCALKSFILVIFWGLVQVPLVLGELFRVADICGPQSLVPIHSFWDLKILQSFV